MTSVIFVSVLVAAGCGPRTPGGTTPRDAAGDPHAEDTETRDTETRDTELPEETGAADDTGAEDGSGIALDVEDDTDGGTFPVDFDVLAVHSTIIANEGHFASAQTCASCHSNQDGSPALVDDAGRPVAPYDLWEATMMASAARDPFWRAAVSVEIASTPSLDAAIQDKCISCHMPAAYADYAIHGRGMISLTSAFSGDLATSSIATDGVTCTVCHQINPDNFGTEESFVGGFEIDDDATIFGAHVNLFGEPMLANTGFEVQSVGHMRESELCATCHTVITTAYTPEGEDTGYTMHEQTVYLEWLNSSFAGTDSCQSCHVPTTDEDGYAIETWVARRPTGEPYPPTAPRTPFGRHLYIGGNTLVPQLMQTYRSVFNPVASDEAFGALVARVREQLLERTATLSIVQAERDGGSLDVSVQVANLTGHKFPTAYPSRRAWLHVTVTEEATGRIVFESCAHDAAGRLVDGGGALLGSELVGGPIQPHHEVIRTEDAVQIYESQLGDPEGAYTAVLLRGSQYIKDNRILPVGWSDAHEVAPRMAPVGVSGDTDFVAGADTVRYVVDLGDASGPLQVDVEMLFVALDPRHVLELLEVETPETRAFGAMWGAADRTPELVATARATVP